MSISDRRTGATYEDALFSRVNSEPNPRLVGGSGYFSTPGDELDPHLFLPGPERAMRPDVRNWIKQHLYAFWSRRYVNMWGWSKIWVAGSGVTYQWDAVRESSGAPGDLDVLIGVDFPQFYRDNPHFAGLSEDDMALVFNDEFRGGLDLQTNNATLPAGGRYEVTFYVNPGATDIRAINPYAAYNVSDNNWTVDPIELPAGWGSRSFPQQWWDAIHAERSHAGEIVQRYRRYVAMAKQTSPGDPTWLNAMTMVHQAVLDGHALFDSVHGERHQAFSKTGKGYVDYYNFRWQAHKRDGLVSATLGLARLDNLAHADVTQLCYNGQIIDAQHARTMAALLEE